VLLRWGYKHRYRNTNVFIDICLRTRTHTHTQFLALEGELTPILVSLVSKDQVEVRGILKTLESLYQPTIQLPTVSTTVTVTIMLTLDI